jgi:hypothetical protein
VLRRIARSSGRPIISSVVAVALIVTISTTAAFGHAILVSSNPSPDSSVSGSHLDISLKFNVRIDAARSRLQLLAPDGKTQNLTVKAGGTLNQLLSEAGNLSPGNYKLIWQVLASDGHITRGEIRFSAK